MPAHPLQQRLEKLISHLAATPDGLSKFTGYRGETITIEPWMAGLLREAEARVRRLRRDVEQRLAGGDPRKCARCRRPFTGRPDRKFCSDTCRQAAYKLRHRPRTGPDSPGAAPSRQRSA